MSELSNNLADLAERVKLENERSAAAHLSAIDSALSAGSLLIDAKEQCKHGEWGSFLSRAHVHERQARRLMQLARSGLTSDMVSDIGGFKAALDWLGRVKLPDPDEVVFITVEGRRDAIVSILPSEKAGKFDVSATSEEGTYFFTEHPVPAESIRLADRRYSNALWHTAAKASSLPIGEWQFNSAPIWSLLDDCAFLAEQVELPKGDKAPLPESYKHMIDALQACVDDFTADRYLKARRAQKLCLAQMDKWPSDPRMMATFVRIASDGKGTQLAQRVDELARERMVAHA
ncbi:hypothetical protein [Mesorhizobium sp. Root552]|uniref:hypothetical protein n=1 Tax=Mesorhizobium sp. Root552 TaxID=1736555 RepID=UPI000AA8CBC0|nr:hypothetical protein [Mesorhizobium sp. Root552]